MFFNEGYSLWPLQLTVEGINIYRIHMLNAYLFLLINVLIPFSKSIQDMIS